MLGLTDVFAISLHNRTCNLLPFAVSSSEVKKRLHEFVISKKQRDIALASLSGTQAFKHWLVD